MPLSSSTFVVVYGDNSNSKYGTSCVGTLTGTVIAFGTEDVFYSGYAYDVGITKLSSSKAVIIYRDVDNSYYGMAIGAEVPGGSSAGAYMMLQAHWRN